MRFLLSILLLCSTSFAQPAAATSSPPTTVDRFFAEALARGQAYENLRVLVGDCPGRLAGSAALARAVDWSERELARLSPDRVYRQEVLVPHWERGPHDSVQLLVADGEPIALSALALGHCGATPAGGVVAEVVAVNSLDELAALGPERVAGKIVFFNRPMDPSLHSPGAAYRGAGDQRNLGPAAAAQLGAVAALNRSLTLTPDDVPHTGATRFPTGVAPIPAAALSWVAADRLTTALASEPHAKVRVDIQARTYPDAISHNVIAEIRGREFPDQVILVGAHLDSWDNTPGAHDDGAGVVQCIEVLRLYRTLGIKPRHTLRCVLFTNEESGLRGSIAYADAVKASGERHVFAIESDSGGFAPIGFSFGGAAGSEPHVRAVRWRPLFEPWGVWNFRAGRGGMDVSALQPLGAIVADLAPDSQRYFEVHHAASDTIDAVNPRELHLGAGALAALVWLVDHEGL